MDDARAGADRRGLASVGVAYVGGRQTAGRGRLDRRWVSEADAGLFVTYHLAPRVDAPLVPLFAAAGALAVSDAAREVSGVETAVKWPNDVLRDGRKLAGVLAEARHGERLEVFLGIGINLRSAALPPEVVQLATSIEDATGSAPALETMLAALSAALERWSRQIEDDPRSFVDAWRGRLVTIGQRVTLATPDGGIAAGEAVDVTATGNLVLLRDDGCRRDYAAGDVTTTRTITSGQSRT